jgi:hypothetical protein
MIKQISLVSLSLVIFSTSECMIQKEKLYIPKPLSPYFKVLKGEQHEGKQAGWLKVEQEKGAKKVLILLKGKSFYDPGVKGDYRVEYWGRDTAGVPSKLPKGLYYWEAPLLGKKGTNFGQLRPSYTSTFAGYQADREMREKSRKEVWFLFRDDKGNFLKDEINWDSSKVEHVHPTKFVNDLLAQLK